MGRALGPLYRLEPLDSPPKTPRFRDIRLRFSRLGRAASLWHWQKLQSEKACLRKAEGTISPGLRTTPRGALESFGRTSSPGKRERGAQVARHFLSGGAATSQNSYTFLFPPIRFVGRAVISYSVPWQKTVLRYRPQVRTLGRDRDAGRSTTLRQMLPEFSDFFCVTREGAPGAIRGTRKCLTPGRKCRRVGTGPKSDAYRVLE